MRRLVFKTKRLILRPLRLSDYPNWYSAYIECLPSKNLWDRGPRSPNDFTLNKFKKYIQRHRKLAQEDKFYFYAVFKKSSNHLIGIIDFDIFARDTHQFANFGYALHNPYWGQGYGREPAAAGLHIGFKHLKLNRLEAAINLENKRSIALVKSIGMRREGIKKRYWFEDGMWVDHLIYVANPEDVGLVPILR